MSDALTEASPETPAGEPPSVEGTDPAVVEAVADGSAGETPAKTVDVERFNGLMSSHQKALSDLRASEAARAALEARLEQQETPVVTESNEEIQALRAELKEQRLETAKAEALKDFPAAGPLADFIVGDTAAEIREVTKAIAQRLTDAFPTPVIEEAAAAASEAEQVSTPAGETAEAVVAPSIAGGTTPPGADEAPAALRAEALAEGSWEKFWQSASTPASALS